MYCTIDSVENTPPLACHRCGAIDQHRVTVGTGPYAYRANCPHCKAFLRWVSRYTPAERTARRQPARFQAMARKLPSAMQLAYLKSLGHTGPEPANMAEASQQIEALNNGRVA